MEILFGQDIKSAKHIATVSDKDMAFTVIRSYIKNDGIKSHYMRYFSYHETPNVTYVDYGSHTLFFYMIEEPK